jgi:hypothetical protein
MRGFFQQNGFCVQIVNNWSYGVDMMVKKYVPAFVTKCSPKKKKLKILGPPKMFASKNRFLLLYFVWSILSLLYSMQVHIFYINIQTFLLFYTYVKWPFETTFPFTGPVSVFRHKNRFLVENGSSYKKFSLPKIFTTKFSPSKLLETWAVWRFTVNN